MYIVTTLSLDELGTLIREKRVSLNNGRLLFGCDAETVDTYFKERIGYSGYVLGFRGRINKVTAGVFEQLDECVLDGSKVILEAEIDEDDMLRYRVKGIQQAADALCIGLTEDAVCEELDESEIVGDSSDGIEILCVPYIKGDSKVRVTSLNDELSFDVEGITFVKLSH